MLTIFRFNFNSFRRSIYTLGIKTYVDKENTLNRLFYRIFLPLFFGRQLTISLKLRKN